MVRSRCSVPALGLAVRVALIATARHAAGSRRSTVLRRAATTRRVRVGLLFLLDALQLQLMELVFERYEPVVLGCVERAILFGFLLDVLQRVVVAAVLDILIIARELIDLILCGKSLS